MQKKIFFSIIILILLISSFSFGCWLKEQKLNNQDALEKSTIAKLEASKFVQSWIVTVYGKVEQVSERNLTLSKEGETLVVPIKEGAKVSSVYFQEGSSASSDIQDIAFEDIQIGDSVTIAVQVDKSGDMEGINLAIIKSKK